MKLNLLPNKRTQSTDLTEFFKFVKQPEFAIFVIGVVVGVVLTLIATIR